MRLGTAQLARLPVCANCHDYNDEAKIVLRQRGWVHVKSNSVRCPGQEEDDTDDRADPLES